MKKQSIYLSQMEDLMLKYRKFGAWDSEPRGFWELIQDNAKKGKRTKITLRHWQLYSSMAGWQEVAKQMTDVAHAFMDAYRLQ